MFLRKMPYSQHTEESSMRGPHVAFILLVVIWALIAVEVSQPSEKIHCFSKVPVNVSGIKPPIVSGPGFPPEAGFKGITLDEVVNGSPRHVLVGFFNFKPLNWTEKSRSATLRGWRAFQRTGSALFCQELPQRASHSPVRFI